MRFCRRAAGAEPCAAPALWQAAEIIAAGAAGCDVVLLASGARARVPHAAVAASGYAEGMAEGGSPDGSDGSDDDGVLVGSRTEAAASAGEESGSGCSEEDEEVDAYGRTSMALAASAAAIMQARAPRGSTEWQRPAVEPCTAHCGMSGLFLGSQRLAGAAGLLRLPQLCPVCSGTVTAARAAGRQQRPGRRATPPILQTFRLTRAGLGRACWHAGALSAGAVSDRAATACRRLWRRALIHFAQLHLLSVAVYRAGARLSASLMYGALFC